MHERITSGIANKGFSGMRRVVVPLQLFLYLDRNRRNPLLAILPTVENAIMSYNAYRQAYRTFGLIAICFNIFLLQPLQH